MATIDEVTAQVTTLVATLNAIDLKLDDIKTFIDQLKVAGVATQEQLDFLGNLVDSAKVESDKVLAETDALDNK